MVHLVGQGRRVGLSDEIEAYAHYRNGLARAEIELPIEEFRQFQEDLTKARAAVEVAWLERGVAGSDKPAGDAGGPSRRELQRPTFGPVETIGHTTASEPDGW